MGGRTYHKVSTQSSDQAAAVSALQLGSAKIPGRQLVGGGGSRGLHFADCSWHALLCEKCSGCALL